MTLRYWTQAVNLDTAQSVSRTACNKKQPNIMSHGTVFDVLRQFAQRAGDVQEGKQGRFYGGGAWGPPPPMKNVVPQWPPILAQPP